MDQLELEVSIEDLINAFERQNPGKYVESLTIDRFGRSPVYRVQAVIESENEKEDEG